MFTLHRFFWVLKQVSYLFLLVCVAENSDFPYFYYLSFLFLWFCMTPCPKLVKGVFCFIKKRKTYV